MWKVGAELSPTLEAGICYAMGGAFVLSNRTLVDTSMFNGFIRQQIDVQGVTINLVRGGMGYPVR